MTQRTYLAALSLTPVLTFALYSTPDVDDHDADELELDEAEVFIEFNHTDGDFGIQFFWTESPGTG